LAVVSFHNSSTQFLRLRGVLTLVGLALILLNCPIVVSRYRSFSHCFRH